MKSRHVNRRGDEPLVSYGANVWTQRVCRLGVPIVWEHEQTIFVYVQS